MFTEYVENVEFLQNPDNIKFLSAGQRLCGGQRPALNLEFCRKICDIKNAHKKGAWFLSVPHHHNIK